MIPSGSGTGVGAVLDVAVVQWLVNGGNVTKQEKSGFATNNHPTSRNGFAALDDVCRHTGCMVHIKKECLSESWGL